jgi:hypothetical protein
MLDDLLTINHKFYGFRIFVEIDDAAEQWGAGLFGERAARADHCVMEGLSILAARDCETEVSYPSRRRLLFRTECPLGRQPISLGHPAAP